MDEYRVVTSREVEVDAGVHAERLNDLAAQGFALAETVVLRSGDVAATMVREAIPTPPHPEI